MFGIKRNHTSKELAKDTLSIYSIGLKPMFDDAIAAHETTSAQEAIKAAKNAHEETPRNIAFLHKFVSLLPHQEWNHAKKSPQISTSSSLGELRRVQASVIWNSRMAIDGYWPHYLVGSRMDSVAAQGLLVPCAGEHSRDMVLVVDTTKRIMDRIMDASLIDPYKSEEIINIYNPVYDRNIVNAYSPRSISQDDGSKWSVSNLRKDGLSDAEWQRYNISDHISRLAILFGVEDSYVNIIEEQ